MLISQSKYYIFFIDAHGNGANCDMEISNFNSSTLINKVQTYCDKESINYCWNVIRLKDLIQEAKKALAKDIDICMTVGDFVQLSNGEGNDPGAYLIQNLVDLINSDIVIIDFSTQDVLHSYNEDELRQKHHELLNLQTSKLDIANKAEFSIDETNELIELQTINSKVCTENTFKACLLHKIALYSLVLLVL